jgi:hypothetical protein
LFLTNMSSEIVLAIERLVQELERQMPLPATTPQAAATTTAVPTVDVPRGALYSAQPPLYPCAGTYCFPTGVLLLSSGGGLASLLGWPLQRIRASRSLPHQQQWRCRCCGMVVSVHIGPFLTSVAVSRPEPPLWPAIR